MGSKDKFTMKTYSFSVIIGNHYERFNITAKSLTSLSCRSTRRLRKIVRGIA